MKPTAWLAQEGLERELERELALRFGLALGKGLERFDRLYVARAGLLPPDPRAGGRQKGSGALGPQPLLHPEAVTAALGHGLDALWAQVSWRECEVLPIVSVSDAAKKLKERGGRWSLISHTEHRRASLIEDEVRALKVGKALDFLSEIPEGTTGAFTLLDRDTLLLAPSTSARVPMGDVRFNEDRVTPPNRAYLKLWELFTVYGIKPLSAERCLDMGACPGGWTWVLNTVGASTVAVDKAPLDARIGRLSGIEFIKKDAFKLEPKEVGEVDWFFWDVICEPDRLLEVLQKWMPAQGARNWVTTMKFKGEADWSAIERLCLLPGARLVHLFHNKHEVTFYSVSSLN